MGFLPCFPEVLSFLFILPCISYFVKIIGQYDDRLQQKQRDAKEQKEQLTKAYNTLLADMDGLLTKSAESSAGLAERSFDSKRRDFQRFLERAKSRYSQLFTGNKGDSDKLLDNFRRFVLNWLRVFEECSIDPIQCPKRVVTNEELMRCLTIGEVCDLTLERLRVTTTMPINIQRDQDKQMISKTRNDMKRHTVQADARMLALADQGMSSANMANRELTTELNAGSGSTSRRCTWLTCGMVGCGRKASETADGYPKELLLVCARIIVLSREHGMLMAGFCVGWLILGSEFFFDAENFSKKTFGEVLLIQICILVLLSRFEEIDVIQQLEREVVELKKAEQNVLQQKEKMHEFWTKAQQLTELWLYRTVPRLDLYKEVHSHLEDADVQYVNPWMSKANEQLELLDKNLGELQAWHNEGTLSLDQKKNFGKTINQVCQESEFEHIAVRLQDISSNGLKCLEAPAAPPSPAKGDKDGAGKNMANKMLGGVSNALGGVSNAVKNMK